MAHAKVVGVTATHGECATCPRSEVTTGQKCPSELIKEANSMQQVPCIFEPAQLLSKAHVTLDRVAPPELAKLVTSWQGLSLRSPDAES